MRTFALALCALLSFGSDTICAQSNRRPSKEQTEFGAGGDFKKAVKLPEPALQALREFKDSYNDLEVCAEEEGIPEQQVPDTWFLASEFRLTPIHASGLLVRGERHCLGGAHISGFWVLEKINAGYKVIFHAKADALEILPSRSNGYRDLQLTLVYAAGADIEYVKFRFLDGSYQDVSHILKHN